MYVLDKHIYICNLTVAAQCVTGCHCQHYDMHIVTVDEIFWSPVFQASYLSVLGMVVLCVDARSNKT